jgi:hypothetical protein
MAQAEKKPWYKSKIILLGAGIVGVFGSTLVNNWLVGQGVTPEQIAALQEAQPDVVQSIRDIQDGGKLMAEIGVLFGAVIIVIRKWFTSKSLT